MVNLMKKNKESSFNKLCNLTEHKMDKYKMIKKVKVIKMIFPKYLIKHKKLKRKRMFHLMWM